jgi:DNA-binding response OmpR family regulator
MSSQAEILVVDDDPDLQETIRVVLEANGYGVRTAGNGREARKALAERLPDLMILDVMMETVTEGFTLAHELREQSRYQELPIILLTCFLDKVRAEGPEAWQHIMGEPWPAQWLFEKPVDTRKLLAKVEAVLQEADAKRRR